MVGVLGLDGVRAAASLEGPLDGAAFRTCLDAVVGPALQPGDILIMDNLSVHKVRGVRETVEARGAQLVYLPPYSPDYSPIEPCWSKVKGGLRTAKARTPEALEAALDQAIAHVSPGDAQGWFQHCGYSPRPT